MSSVTMHGRPILCIRREVTPTTKIINDRTYSKPVVNAESQYLGDQIVDDWRKLQWNMVMTGGYFDTGYDHIFMDPDNHYDYFPPGWKLDVPKNLLAMAQMNYLYDFFSQEVEFWNIAPSDNLVTSGTAYCLANAGAGVCGLPS